MTTRSAADDPVSIWLLPALKEALHALDAVGLRCLADAEMRMTFAHERAAAFALRELEFSLSLLVHHRSSTSWSRPQALALAISAKTRVERLTAQSVLPRRARGEIARRLQQLEELLAHATCE